MTATSRRALILVLLAALMATTRVHHFAAVPDASWAVFFLGGFYLRDWTRWAFPALMALAVLVDALVITAQGLSFWQHYCISPAYWALVPAHLALWGGGWWLRNHHRGIGPRSLGLGAASLLVSVALCHLVAQGSFYWLSASVPAPDLAGWWKNYSDWLPAYLGVAALYAGLAAAAHATVARLQAGQPALDAPRR
ncbi:hypothetical protein H0E84_09940 [Luteimonas sp. SJ-92]|uniref:Uncharacterized protein n=1 Tax=Luteimonas salinisoli TaxID=2752307 RepID=A0A853JDM6_9GAMM|nr:hypothetical protein [Luteimonas salinisoli]NZA26707.1 hypothetical protein [Luteimonas salinisoli]